MRTVIMILLMTFSIALTFLLANFSEPVPARTYEPPIPSDCSRDVTYEFNSWLATVPDGSTIDLAHNGCYLVNETIRTPGPMDGEGILVFRNRKDIILDGHGATIKTTRDVELDHERAQLYFESGGGFVVRNLTLQGTNLTPDCTSPKSCYDPAREHDANVRVRAVDGLLLDGVQFKNAWGDGVEVDPGRGTLELRAVMSRNVTIQRSTVDTTGRHAFACTGCSNFVVQDNKVTNIGYHVVDVETHDDVASGDLTLLRNTFSHFYLSIVAATSRTGSKWGPFVVQHNVATDIPATCSAPFLIGSYPARYGPVKITDNNIVSYQAGVQVDSVSEVNVRRNTMTVWQGPCISSPHDPSGYGIGVSNTPRGSIIRNTFIGANSIALVKESTVTVCSNRMTHDGPFDQPVRC